MKASFHVLGAKKESKKPIAIQFHSAQGGGPQGHTISILAKQEQRLAQHHHPYPRCPPPDKSSFLTMSTAHGGLYPPLSPPPKNIFQSKIGTSHSSVILQLRKVLAEE